MLSETLKVEEKKVSLVFLFKAQEPRYGYSPFDAQVVRFKLSSEEEIANISAPWPQIKKVRTLCFLKL